MEKIFGGRKAALIDMDGVLYDSMPGHTLAWKEMMESVRVDCTRDEFYLYEGMTGVATINLLMRRAFGHEVSAERAAELYEIKSRNFKKGGPAPLMPGADRMLAALRTGGLKCVLVTGSGQSSLLEALDRDYPGAFGQDCRVTARDVANGKPDPEPYLRGAEKAGVSSSEAIVIENAPLGVRAGKASGAFTIAVTTGPIPREAFEKEGADMIFGSMEEFADWLEKELPDVVHTEDVSTTLRDVVKMLRPDCTFLLTDSNVAKLDALAGLLPEAERIVIPAGEESKSLDTAVYLWNRLVSAGATRNSLLVNAGGGVVSDLGGFVAATFKRGIRYVNVPTTLLAAADAAVGGKTGIDFAGLKNEIGAFHCPEKVIVSTKFFDTLPRPELLSGLSEVIKTALLTDAELYRAITEGDILTDRDLLARAVRHAARAKEEIVKADPRDRGLRRILNLGHTAGHAFEMLAASRRIPLSHGEAVAHGILVALRLSERYEGCSPELADTYERRILRRYYPPLPFGPEDREELLALMTHDKKNTDAAHITFVLMRAAGSPVIRALKLAPETKSDAHFLRKEER